MEAHAHAVCSGGGDVLNVGFGMGLVDEARPHILYSFIAATLQHSWPAVLVWS